MNNPNMADLSDRERGGRRPRRKRGNMQGRGSRDQDRDIDVSPAPVRTPIILAKPAADQSGSIHSPMGPSSIAKPSDKPVMMLRSRDEPSNIGASPHAPSAFQGDISNPPLPSYQIHRNPMTPAVGQSITDVNTYSRLAPPPEMTRCVKLVDEMMHWCDKAVDFLVDQTDYIVVGVLGLQGCGKSTVMSLLAGNTPKDNYRDYIFAPQSREVREIGSHQTSGIDIFINGQRTILLDVQPMLSASVLDNIINPDKKLPPEYATGENCVEVQSLQLATFIMTVCNVVLVVQDWFTDLNFIRFLLAAEMLKPSPPSTSHEGGMTSEDPQDYHSNIVFVQNKSKRDDFSLETYTAMQDTLSKVLESTKLKHKGCVSLSNDNLLPGLASRDGSADVNLFLLPSMDVVRSEQDAILTFLPEYRGYPSFQHLLKSIRNQLISMNRTPLTHASLSEKNWFHYAARNWDAIKKSQLIAEYNRLLP